MSLCKLLPLKRSTPLLIGADDSISAKLSLRQTPNTKQTSAKQIQATIDVHAEGHPPAAARFRSQTLQLITDFREPWTVL